MRKISKYDVLDLLAKKLPFYTATQWLKTPNENLDNAIPSDLLKNDEVQKVYEVLKKETEKDG